VREAIQTRFLPGAPQLRFSSHHKPNKQRQINIDKQNNHNAHGNNRPGRRAKIDFRATARQGVRSVIQLAKPAPVQILTISNVRGEILEAIDDLAACKIAAVQVSSDASCNGSLPSARTLPRGCKPTARTNCKSVFRKSTLFSELRPAVPGE
jgi:hypothetical protein